MPKTGKPTTHARSRFSRCLCTAVIAVLLLLSLHGTSLAGTHTHDGPPHAASDVAATHKCAPPPQLRSSLGTFAVPQGVGIPIVSLQAACRSEIKLYCGAQASASSPLRCLVAEFYRLHGNAEGRANSSHRSGAAPSPSAFSDVCESWLTARDACLSFVHTQGKELCGATAVDARECLRQIPAAFLPAKCVTSDYYEGVRLVGKLRQHQTADARLRRIHEQ